MTRLLQGSLASWAVLAAFAASSPAGAGGALDDAVILGIFDQANTSGIAAGRPGAKKGDAPEAKALATMAVADREAVPQTGRDLARRPGVAP
jgi:hypothetical protein